MKFLVAVVFALALCAADGRVKRLFGSQDAQVRIYTAHYENSASAAEGDCFVGKCPFDVTMPFLMGDVCPQVDALTAATGGNPIDLATGNINLEGLFYEFFKNEQCPTKFTEIFGNDWNTYTANLDVPVYIQFIEGGVLGGAWNKQCPADRATCGAHPNGVVRLNFIFDNFCGSKCVVEPIRTPTVVPPGGGGGGGGVPPGPGPTDGTPSPVPSPSRSPLPNGTVLGPIIVQPGGATPQPPNVIVFPVPEDITPGTKEEPSPGSTLQVSSILPLLAIVLYMVF